MLRGLGQGAEFLGFVFLARHLGPTDFGTLSVAFLICRYAGLVADWGASLRGARHVAASGGAGSIHGLVARRNQVTAALSITYVVVVIALGYAQLIPLVFAIVGRGLSRDWIALGREHGTRSSVPAVVQGCVLAATSAFAHTELSAAIAVAAGYGTGAVLSVLLNRLPAADDTEPASLDGWMLTAVMADQVTASTDTLLIAALRTTREAGIYAAVYRIPNAWITVIGLVVIGLIPAATRAVIKDRSALSRLRRKALRTGFLGGALVAATIPLSYYLVPVLFGEAYNAGRVPLVILLAATAVAAAAAPLHPLYLALAHDRALALVSASAAALNLVANLVLIPPFGMTAAASTTLAAQVGLFFFFWFASVPREHVPT